MKQDLKELPVQDKDGSNEVVGPRRVIMVGAVNPADGQLVRLIVHHNDTETLQAFLDTMAQEVPAGENRSSWCWIMPVGINQRFSIGIISPPFICLLTARTTTPSKDFCSISSPITWQATSQEKAKLYARDSSIPSGT